MELRQPVQNYHVYLHSYSVVHRSDDSSDNYLSTLFGTLRTAYFEWVSVLHIGTHALCLYCDLN